MITNRYDLENTEAVLSPALVYYQDILQNNIQLAIQMAGGAQRLWPHVKTHKSADVVRMMRAAGIERYKCATIAEAEMLADCQAPHILLAYPLVGPNIERYLTLIERYPQSRFYALGDDAATLRLLSDAAQRKGVAVNTLLDVNLGMNRTGLAVDKASDVYAQCAKMHGLALCGLHCYDGHHSDKDFTTRCQRVEQAVKQVDLLIQKLNGQGLSCPIRIMAGTPSFPCHTRYAEEYLSPGTCFLMDYGYMTNVPDLQFIPAAALMTRVVSHPAEGLFTLDLGYKGIASDPPGIRGVIVNLEEAEPILHSEEHWVWRMKPDSRRAVPPIGSVWYVIPTHICPTSALYPAALVAEDHQIVGEWPITARNRKLTV